MRIGLLNRWLRGLPELEAAISAEKGLFSLFALLEKEEWDEQDNTCCSWRLYVAAPWIWKEECMAEDYLRQQVRPYEDTPAFRVPNLRVEIVKPTSPYLEEVWEYCDTENGMVEIYDVEILDITARRGYIFASRRPHDFDEIRQAAQQELERERQGRLAEAEMRAQGRL